GVRVGESVPPTLAPVFINPDNIPACRLERSTVEFQYAPTEKYRKPAPRDNRPIARSGCAFNVPSRINSAASPMPAPPTADRPKLTPTARASRSVAHPPRGHKSVIARNGAEANSAPRRTLYPRTLTR